MATTTALAVKTVETRSRRGPTALGSFLREHGADTVSIASLDYVLDRENPLFARLEAFLRQ